MSDIPAAPGGTPPDGAAARQPLPPRRSSHWRAGLRPAIVSLISIVVVFGALALWVTSSQTWPRVQLQFFNLDAMIAAFPQVLQGFWVSMRIWLTALVFIGAWAL